MKRLPRLLRSTLAVLGGLLLTGALAAPAAAEAPRSTPAPTPFYNSAEGEDGCTLFETAGEAAWPVFYPVPDAVAITGKASIGVGVPPGTPCLPVVPANRQIEFTGHVNDWPAVEHVVPMPPGTQESEYAFDLEAPDGAEIEYITMRICQEPRADGTEWPGRCGPTVLIEHGTASEEPHCEFDFAIPSDWGSGYTGQVTITAAEPVGDWYAIITFPGGQTLGQIWNADTSQSGTGFTVTPSSWNGQIPVGDSVQFGFVVSGSSQPPPEIEVWADGHRCTEA